MQSTAPSSTGGSKTPDFESETTLFANDGGEQTALATYEAMADVYDRFKAHDDYERWMSIVVELLEAYGVAGGEVLDVACGTGNSTLGLKARGWSVRGCDLSPSMVRAARAKSECAGIDFFVADLRCLPRGRLYHVVTAINDAANYLLCDDDLAAALRGVRAVLESGGTFLFDVNTLLAYRTWFAATHVFDQDDAFFVWRGGCTRDFCPDGVARADLACFTRDGRWWQRRDCTHLQRHFSLSTLRTQLTDAGFSDIAVFGVDLAGRIDSPDESRHQKAIVLARR